MVRYFPNKLEDFKPATGAVEIDKNDIINQIDEHMKLIVSRMKPTFQSVDGGLYVGITGVSFMLYHLSKNPAFKEKQEEYINKAAKYLEPALNRSAGDATSFLLGDAGTFALAAVVLKHSKNEKYLDNVNKYKSLYNAYLKPDFLPCGGEELFVGRAGYLAGALWMSRELKTPIFSPQELYKICDIIVENGRVISRSSGSPSPLMYHYYNTQYLGAAHGSSFILLMLVSVPGYMESNVLAASDIKNSINYLTLLQSPEGNWPSCMEEVGESEHKLIHWCHGAPGTIYLMAKAYLIFKEKVFLDACKKAADLVWSKGLLHKGPGICHGIAGNGYVFLLMYRLTGEPKYLHRANAFAAFMNSEQFLNDARVPDNPYSLYEGTAGTVCFLADLLNPDKAEFPFQDVFTVY